MALEDNFLGRGWSFPPTFHPAGVAITAGVEDIERSLDILFTTRLGERVLSPDYGSDLEENVFEAINTRLLATIREQVRVAILLHEPRIELIEVTAEEPPESLGTLLIEVQFRVRATNSRRNYVFPFYLKEGTDLPK